MLKDNRLEELTDGIMEQFRIIRNREGVMDEERKVADSLANMYGKVLKAYMVELAYDTFGAKLPNETKQAKAISQ